MPRIIWEGNQDWDREFADEPLPENAVKISQPDDIVKGSTPYMILPCAVCMASVFIKSRMAGDFLLDLWFMPLGFLIGFLVAMPLHEFLHAVCYPRGATVYIGVCLKRLRAYAVSFSPVTKRRFIVMSLAPALSGVAALGVFSLCPFGLKPLLTISMVSAFMGLISPAPDYMTILHVLRQAPEGAMIQASNQGLFWYKSS